MPPALRIRPYKDFLTPALHRRFTRAAAGLLIFCYVVAVLIGQWDSLLWSWFPFGRAGIRTGLLFICTFTIFVLRVAQLHVGIRATDSPFQTFRKYLFRFQTLQTAGWYMFSAWLFSEVYIFSTPSSAGIRWITGGNIHERPKLNERPIYLTTYFLMLALLQTAYHLYCDYDRINIPVKKTRHDAQLDQRSHITNPPSAQLKTGLPGLISSASKRAFVMTILGPFIYTLTIRKFAWDWTLYFAKIFWRLPKSTALPTVSPFYITFIGRTFLAGFILISLWEAGNAVFSAYVAQEPLKNERPITYESRDPNGSLLTGLRGKKLQTRAFAFWELVCIAQQFEGRRKAIFEDIDRKGGSTWLQILEVCLGVIDGINLRITKYLTPPSPPQPVEEPGLPRLTPPLKEDDIWSPLPKRNTAGATIVRAASLTIRTHSSPRDGSPMLKMIEKSKSQVLTSGREGVLSSAGILGAVHPLLYRVLQGPFGWPFRQTFRRRIAVIVLGSPYGYVGLIVDAVDAVAYLAVCSLKEDPYGNVQRDVARIIHVFTASIKRLEDFKGNLDMHWTDVEHKRESPEVDTILAALKGGLHDILETFGEYTKELRLSQRDMRSAREAAAPPQTKNDAQRGAESQTEKNQSDKRSAREATTSHAKKPVEMRERPKDSRRPRIISPLAEMEAATQKTAGGARQSSSTTTAEGADERR